MYLIQYDKINREKNASLLPVQINFAEHFKELTLKGSNVAIKKKTIFYTQNYKNLFEICFR